MLGWSKWVGERFMELVNQLLVVTQGGGVGRTWLHTNHGNVNNFQSKGMGESYAMC